MKMNNSILLKKKVCLHIFAITTMQLEHRKGTTVETERFYISMNKVYIETSSISYRHTNYWQIETCKYTHLIYTTGKKLLSIEKVQWKHSHVIFWFPENGMAPTTNRYCHFNENLTWTVMDDKCNLQCTKLKIYIIMHELPLITTFWSRVRWFANDFHEWRSHEWKSLANHHASDKTSLFTTINVFY